MVDVSQAGGNCVARMALTFLIEDGSSSSAQDAAVCSFREGRKARNSARRRIDDIPFFEHIEIGDEIDLGAYAFGASEIDDFQALTGDELAGSGKKPSCVPPWHLPAAWMQRMVKHYAGTTAKYDANKQPFPRLGPAAIASQQVSGLGRGLPEIDDSEPVFTEQAGDVVVSIGSDEGVVRTVADFHLGDLRNVAAAEVGDPCFAGLPQGEHEFASRHIFEAQRL
jgi:hypothetical protein